MHFPYGNNLKLFIEGESHSEKIEMFLFGFPSGVKVDFDELNSFLKRRSPGNNSYTSQRVEADIPEFVGGIKDGITDGGCIHAVIYNKDVDSSSYTDINDIPRPSHADYAAICKYGSGVDLRGGGHFSGRLTAVYCVAGALCLQYLKSFGVNTYSHIYSIGNVSDDRYDMCHIVDATDKSFPLLNSSVKDDMINEILKAKESGDSVGGVIECAVNGLPVGLGEHLFAGVEARISSAVFAIPGVKGIEFGSGFEGVRTRGSQNNDCFDIVDGKIVTVSNNAGGINGGMTNGMPVVFRCAIKPTPSISKTQQSVSVSRKETVTINVNGRHDPCVAIRALPVVEAAAAIAITDMLLDAPVFADASLETFRNDIDICDSVIASALAKRFDISEKIGCLKSKQGIAVENTEREKVILNNLISYSGGKHTDKISDIYELIFQLSKSLQK